MHAINRLISAFVVLVQGKRYNTNTLAQSRVCFVDKFEVTNLNSYELKKNICFFFLINISWDIDFFEILIKINFYPNFNNFLKFQWYKFKFSINFIVQYMYIKRYCRYYSIDVWK